MARRMGPIKRAWLWTIKHTLNPLTLRMARQGFGPFSLVRHTGGSPETRSRRRSSSPGCPTASSPS